MAESWLKELNPQQLAAVTHGEGPLLIIAGAGTGKTRTLACRVAWLIQQGTDPERLMLLTFTRRAAEEMLRRAETVCRRTLSRVWGGTFHAVANRLLRRYGRAVGLTPDFTVMDESDSAHLLGMIRARFGLGAKEKRFPRKATIRAIYSRLANSRLRLAEVLGREYPWCRHAEDGLAAIFAEYTRRKQERQLLDFDDLLILWNELLARTDIQPELEARFDHILVDEYQDTNIIQAEILRRLRRDNRNLTVVGDDAQSIYSFRAATIRNILDFPVHFPGTAVVTLEQNYRSVQPILDLGNAIMEQARFRYTKRLHSNRQSAQKPILITCRDELEQTATVCDAILEHREQGIPLHEQAVLFRTGYHSDMLEIELTRRGIPFRKYGGLRFLEAAHVKDVMAILRIAENPRDEVSWFRVLEMLPGIGPRTAQRFFGELAGREFDMRRLAEIEMPAAAGEEFDRFCALLTELGRIDAPPLPSQLELLRRYYEPLVPRLYDNPEPRLRDLGQLQLAAARFKTRTDFLADLTLDPPDSTADLASSPIRDEDWITLSTMHSAKGCEWDVVYIIHAADGNIPSDMAAEDEEQLEEERRLFYVAVTRARDWLYILFPLRYYFRRPSSGDDHSWAQLTRFLTPTVLSLMHQPPTQIRQGERPEWLKRLWEK